MIARSRIDLGPFEAFLFDLDGVVTRTARVHAAAWKRLFDDYDYLARRASAEGTAFVPFDAVEDYRKYVDGKPRQAGAGIFLGARGISLPAGSPDDGPEADTLSGLGNRKDLYFNEALAHQGVEVYKGAVRFVREARARGVRTAIVSSSRNCAAVLDAAGLTRLFDVRVDGVDLRRLGLPGKPAPEMFLEAARRLDTSAVRAPRDPGQRCDQWRQSPARAGEPTHLPILLSSLAPVRGPGRARHERGAHALLGLRRGRRGVDHGLWSRALARHHGQHRARSGPRRRRRAVGHAQ